MTKTNGYEVVFYRDGELAYTGKVPTVREMSYRVSTDGRYHVFVNASSEDTAGALAYAYLMSASEKFRKTKRPFFERVNFRLVKEKR